ncbi:MAG: asparaginase domain-containing protein [Planctomycetota bacterium]
MRRVTLITTGGTMEKEYDERTGTLVNRRSVLDQMLGNLRLEDARVTAMTLLNKDSLDLTDSDRQLILHAARSALDAPLVPGETAQGVVIVHGTDTLALTGELLASELGSLSGPVVLTGAMRPYELARSDAVQNLTEAIFATGVLEPGVYAVTHGRALRFPGVVKDTFRGTFTREPASD